jgi:hypothetical protein
MIAMTSQTEKLTFPVPLGVSDFDFAREFSSQQKDSAKARQVFLNTLAVRAVNFYCQFLDVETDLEKSDSWDTNARILMDVADLKIKHLGEIECRAILAGEEVCHIPPEVWSDRIGYVVVEIDEEIKMGTLVGFVKKVETEQIFLKQLNSLEDFIDVLYSSWVSVSYQKAKKLELIKQRLEILFEWEETDKILAGSGRSRRSRNVNQSSDKFQDSSSIIEFDKAKLIKIGNREFAMIVDIEQEENEKMQLSFQLISCGDIRSLPSGLELALISPSGKVLASTTAKTGDNSISVPSKKPATMELEKLERVREQEKLYQVKITLNDKSYTEYFPSSSSQ